MKYIKLTIVLILFSSALFSQLGAGYMGKRFVVGYGFNFSPAVLGSNGAEASILGRGSATGGDMAFNTIHDGFLEFAFKNRTSVGLSCKYYKTTFDNYVEADINTVANGYSTSFSGRPSGFSQIMGLNYTLYFKFFNKRYVAPWGRYFILGPSVNSYKCSYDPSTMKIQDIYTTTTFITDFGPQEQWFVRGDLLFGWGRSRIVANRVVIDYGINFEAIALGFTLWDSVGESPLDIFSGERTTNLNYFEKTARRRVREVNRLNVFVKIGLLLF